ncbi:hypothetical protein BZZ01_01840 [Nostocales cyanobacterium HT-58-2]|nr:hypothetical protein BZZ01_01840 [Nostocales cyanobacterium HT-58-2]
MSSVKVKRVLEITHEEELYQMNDQKLPKNQDTHKAEAQQLLKQANKHLGNKQLGEALQAYLKALVIYLEIGKQIVATLISYLISRGNNLTVNSTDKSGKSKINLNAASGLLANRSRVKRRK